MRSDCWNRLVPMPNTMTTLCIDAVRAVAMKSSDCLGKRLITRVVSQGVATLRNFLSY